MNWTEPQYEAITYKENKNVLVAAAAGSGKTAVLVERIIQKILDPQAPVSVDELLVLTFTDAAAKEMKNKIASAITKKLKEQPDNKHLKKQSLRVASADISTIHSFAKKIIENNIHLTDIPAGFTIIDSAENEFLLNEALSSCLERYYSHFDSVPPFAQLAVGYGGIKNDSSLREAILKLYDFSKSMANPVEWLNTSAEMYGEVYRSGTIENSAWEKLYLDCIKSHTQHILGYYDVMNGIIEQNFSESDKLYTFIKSETKMLKGVLNCETLSEYFDYLNCVSFGTKPRVPASDEVLKYASDRITDLRNTAKKEFVKPVFMRYKDFEEASAAVAALYPRVKTLKNIVLMLMRKHTKLKRKDSYLDFSDLEHELIKLLMKHDGTPSEFCKKLGKKYNEILVDEYQDTNNIQDTLFQLLSDGRGNIFMVGDLKQSIYGFRNASPELFLNKYINFGKSDRDGHLIKLSNNFRSRDNVVDSVNFVFRNIMHEKTADIEYTEDEYLHQSAKYPSTEDEEKYCTEMLLTNVQEGNSYAEQSKSGSFEPSNNKRELEAETVAKRILKLIYEDNFHVTDKESGKLRPIEFGDIVILCRSTKNAAPIFEQVFYKYGIPLSSNAESGFLDSIEVRTIISFLEIIDNPLQDIPLVAVMRSPMFGFTADELANIRVAKRRGYFYDALTCSAENGNAKSLKFLETLNRLRDKSAYMGIDELIYTIYSELDYMAAAAAMPGGEIRKANLKLLFDRASSFERTSLKGLFNFVSYLERVGDSNTDFSQGKASSSRSAVSMTTIHKSKGLEYPVVILAHTSSSSAKSAPFVFNEHIGIGMNYVDTNTRIRYSSLSMEIIKYINKKQETAEEMRLLYVAMTRAKEKLIISCTNEGVSKQWLKPQTDKNNKIAPVFVESTNVFRDWLVFAYLNHRDAKELDKLMLTDISEIVPDSDGGHFKFEYIGASEQFEQNKAVNNLKNPDEDKSEKQNTIVNSLKTTASSPNITLDEVKAVLDYRYPYESLTKIPLKLSVSEIKERLLAENDEEGGYIPKHSSVADRNFKQAVSSKAAETGTITHFVMQHINPKNTDTAEDVRHQISQMTANGIITEAQAETVDLCAIHEFFASNLGKRVIKAAENNTLKREFKFLIPINASEIYSELCKNNGKNNNGNIIVQGVVDCFFFENNEIVLLDYKTDNCTSLNASEHAKRYRIQADLYARGLEMIYKKRVKEKIIYFMKPKTAVLV